MKEEKEKLDNLEHKENQVTELKGSIDTLKKEEDELSSQLKEKFKSLYFESFEKDILEPLRNCEGAYWKYKEEVLQRMNPLYEHHILKIDEIDTDNLFKVTNDVIKNMKKTKKIDYIGFCDNEPRGDVLENFVGINLIMDIQTPDLLSKMNNPFNFYFLIDKIEKQMEDLYAEDTIHFDGLSLLKITNIFNTQTKVRIKFTDLGRKCEKITKDEFKDLFKSILYEPLNK